MYLKEQKPVGLSWHLCASWAFLSSWISSRILISCLSETICIAGMPDLSVWFFLFYVVVVLGVLFVFGFLFGFLFVCLLDTARFIKDWLLSRYRLSRAHALLQMRHHLSSALKRTSETVSGVKKPMKMWSINLVTSWSEEKKLRHKEKF